MVKKPLIKILIIFVSLNLVFPISLINAFKPEVARAIEVGSQPEEVSDPSSDFGLIEDDPYVINDPNQVIDPTYQTDPSQTSDRLGVASQVAFYQSLEALPAGHPLKIPKGFGNLLLQTNRLTERIFQGPGIDRIFFKNPADEYLIFGEPCLAPATDLNFICDQDFGDQWIKDHPEHDIFPNGLWDGPIESPKGSGNYVSMVDSRIIEMLMYLVAPKSEGGAGRERITISKIGDYSQFNKEQKLDSKGNEPEKQKNAHRLNIVTPGNYLRNNGVIQAIDISEIDSVRITTKITKKRRVGGDKTNYKFQRPMPLKVAWQSDYGQNKAGVPPVDVLTGAEDMFKSGLIDLLAEFDLGENLTPDDLSDVDLRSIANFIGSEMLASSLGAPKGSLSGFDVGDTLEKMGRYIIADEFKLPREAFAVGDSLNDVERNLGQYILEQRFNLPHGSFSGQFSSELVKNTGRRWLEEDIFNVAPGTLDYETKLDNREERANLMLERLGKGRIAKVFNFNPSKEWFEAKNFDQLKAAAGLRFSLLYNKNADAAYIDDYLGIGETFYDANDNPNQSDPNNFLAWLAPNPSSAEHVTSDEFISRGAQDESWVKNYLRTIGKYDFQASIGILNRQLNNENDLANLVRGADKIGSLTYSSQAGTGSITYNYAMTLRNLAAGKGLDEKTLDPVLLDKIFKLDPANPAETTRTILENLVNSDAVYNSTLPADRGNLANYNPVYVISMAEDGIYGVNENRIRAYLPQALDRIINALQGAPVANQYLGGNLKTLNEVIARAYMELESPDETTRKNAQAVLDALNKAKEYGLAYLDTASESRQLIGATAADGAMGFSVTPELLNQIRANNNDAGANEIAASLQIMAEPTHSLVNLIQEGDIAAVLPTIGVLKIAEKTSSSTRDQAAVQLGLFNNLQSFFNNLADLGLSQVQINGRFGLIEGDYDRLFLKNMASNVFERIGQAEILAAVWRHPEFQDEVNRVRQNPEYQNLEAAANEANQELSFYASRVKRLFQLANRIQQKSTALDASLNDFKDNIQTIVNLFACASGQESCQNLNFQTVGGFKDFVRNLEFNYGNANSIINQEKAEFGEEAGESANLVNEIQQDMAEFGHIYQEIIEGQEMRYDRPDNIIDPSDLDLESRTNYQRSRQGACWRTGEVVGLFLNSDSPADFGHNSEDYLKKIGGCELDQKLFLPIGSTYFFYTMADHTADNFYISVGIAHYSSLGKGLPDDWSEVKETGRKIVVSSAVAGVAARSRLFRSVSKEYGITENDIYLMVTGQTGAVVTRVGGSLIDQRLSFTPGTTSLLINPCGGDKKFKEYLDTTGRNCQDKGDREEIRTHIMAREALRELGLETIGLPLDVDLTQGNFRDNLGLARLSRVLGGLKVSNDQNHPYETLDQIVEVNGLDKTMAAFGVTPTPFMNLLNELRLRTQAELSKITPLLNRTDSNLSNSQAEIRQKFEYYTAAIQELARVYQVSQTELWNAIRAQRHFYWLPNPASLTNNDIIIDLAGKFIYIEGDWQFIQDRILNKEVSGKALIDLLPSSVYNWLNQDIDLTAKQPRNQTKYTKNLISSFRGNAIAFQGNLRSLNLALGLGPAYASLPDIDPESPIDGKKAGVAADDYYGQATEYNYGDGVGDDDKRNGDDEGHNLQLVSNAQADNRLPQAFTGNEEINEAKLKSEVPSIERVLLGQVDIDKLVADFGKISLWKLGADIVSAKFPDTFIGQALAGYDQLRQVVAVEGGQDLPPIEYLFSGKYASEHGGEAFWSELLTGRSDASAATRGFLFDKFLSHAFTAKFESQAGLTYGTMRDLFARPYLARELAVDEGMTQLSAELFKSNRDDSRDMLETKSALSQVYQAGFLVRCNDKQLLDDNNRHLDNAERKKMIDMCQTRGSYFTYKFNSPRAWDKMQELVDERITSELNRTLGNISKAIGVTIPMSDIWAIAHGDVNTIMYVGAAFTVTQANRQAYDEDRKEGRNFNDSGRVVGYDLARLATVGAPNGPAVERARSQGQNSYDQDVFHVFGLSQEDLDDDYDYNYSRDRYIERKLEYERQNGREVSQQQVRDQFNRERNQSGRIQAEEKNDQIKKVNQERFRYRMMDLALYRVNPNFPLGFSNAFFSSEATDQTRSDALLLFGINNLVANTNAEWAGLFAAFTPNGQPIGLSTVQNFRSFLDTVSCEGVETSAACRTQIFSALASNEALLNFVDGNFQEWVGGALGVELKYGMEGLFDGLVALGITGKINEDVSFARSDCSSSDPKVCQRTLTSLTGVVENWASDRIFAWADHALGFDAGVSQAIYVTGKKLLDALDKYRFVRSHSTLEVGIKYGAETDLVKAENQGAQIKDDAKADFRAAKAAFVTFVVTTIFETQIANAEQKLGLVPGTGAMLVGMLVSLAFAVPVDPITIALFIGLNLFGYYKIVVRVRGTADGYYPMIGQYGDFSIGGQRIETNSHCLAQEADQEDQPADCQDLNLARIKTSYFQYPSPDVPIGEFDGKNNQAYRQYLKDAANAKIRGLLYDLVSMPERWSKASLDSGRRKQTYDLMPLQVYTMQKSHVDSLQVYLNRPNCLSENVSETNGGCGYGAVKSRQNSYSGFFSNVNGTDYSFYDHIHVGY